MANKAHLAHLKEGVDAWNAWRKAHPSTRPDLSATGLSGIRLSFADLSNTNLSHANLSHANLSFTNLTSANLSNANLTSANLTSALQLHLHGAQMVLTPDGSPTQPLGSRDVGLQRGCHLFEASERKLI